MQTKLKKDLQVALKASVSLLVRSSGFEPPRGCPRQPLKLVRLPFRHYRTLELWLSNKIGAVEWI